jgi:hypothetical protein
MASYFTAVTNLSPVPPSGQPAARTLVRSLSDGAPARSMDRAMVRRPLLLLTLTVLALTAAPAHAVERWASPTSADATGNCLPVSPCRIDHAVNNAAPGDVVIGIAGDYNVTTALVAPANVTIKSADGQGAAILKGATTLTNPTLTMTNGGGALYRLGIGARATGRTALRARDTKIERMSIVSETAVAVELDGTTGTTLARDSVIVSRSTNAAHHALELTGGGDIALRNLTIWSHNGASGLECGGAGAQTLVNTIVRGLGASDITASGCEARHSNFRPGASPGVNAGAGNQSGAPVLGDAIVDFRPRTGSPTTNAGTEDALLGPLDFDGLDRRRGGRPDIGAHESMFDDPAPAQPQPQPTQENAAPPVIPPATDPAPVAEEQTPPAPPQLGRRIVLGADTGTVMVKRPGTDAYVPLEDLDSLPVGTLVDSRDGSVTLSTSLGGGRTQTGTFGGGLFEVRQDRRSRGVTDIVLRGGTFGDCGKPSRSLVKIAFAAGATRRKKVVRRLWARDKGGRFRTHGRNSVATVRGTRWVTEDRCDGTLTRVTEGAVDVRAKGAKKAVRVRAGRSLLVGRVR